MKITKKQFKIFKKEVSKWVEIFGLKSWQIHFSFRKLNGNRAQIQYNCVDGVATIALNKNWKEVDSALVTDEAIRKSGFHEVCELFLGRLNDMVSQRYNLHEMDVEEEIHRIIRTLENTVWEKDERGL